MFLEADRYWGDFCRVVEREDLLADPRYADLRTRAENSPVLMAELDALFAQRTYEEWKAVLAGLDAPWAPVQSVPELVDDPQVLANGYVADVETDGVQYQLPNVPVQFDGHPAVLRRAAEHGEHTETILLDLGYDWDEISALRDAGAIS
jgi:crotonobetainyl-CoA:carnitine CoA-transferase CaiB-like acyl-CoA transferase